MNIYKSFVADTPVNVYWLFINSHISIDRIVSDDGRVIHIDGEAHSEMMRKIKDEQRTKVD